jgi:hypothetical protein
MKLAVFHIAHAGEAQAMRRHPAFQMPMGAVALVEADRLAGEIA